MPAARPELHHPIVLVLRHRGISFDELAASTGSKPDALRVALHGQGRMSPRLRRLIAAYVDLPESVCFKPDDKAEASA
jgi:lambda repressor-like predicted transcriptional regulator